MKSTNSLTRTERRAAESLAGIFGLRMFGLFLLYPVFAGYAHSFPGATALTIGVALGIYGLTQALLQLPFGMLSDHIGRKPVITLGLAIFVIGSVMAALSHTIGGIIAGRAVQGAGAVGAATLALAADLTRAEHRTKAIAMIGSGIGLAFAVAVVAGPAINAAAGLEGIFGITAVLGACGLVVLWLAVPTPVRSLRHRSNQAVPALLGQVLKDRELQRLYASIFALHLMLAALFMVLPAMLGRVAGLAKSSEWLFYLPVLTVGLVLMVPAVIYAERQGKIKPVALGAIAVLALTPLWLGLGGTHRVWLAFILAVFFGAFTLMEALLPSLISRLARPESKGSALGVYSTSQFLGIFAGGVLGGLLLGRVGETGVFALIGVAGLAWLAFFATLKPPRMLASRMFTVDASNSQQARRLAQDLEAVAGVEEAVILAEEGVAVVRVDAARLDEAALARILPDSTSEAV
ncbi:MAG: MFS transporter [Gammaproteobacteria bacterium]